VKIRKFIFKIFNQFSLHLSKFGGLSQFLLSIFDILNALLIIEAKISS